MMPAQDDSRKRERAVLPLDASPALITLAANFSMKPIQNVSVFGLGKLGSCIAATFAARGFKVTGIDIDPEKVKRVNAGLPPVDSTSLASTSTRKR